MHSQLIEISKLNLNTGQIEGVPKNPRFIKDEKYKKLLQSLKDHPEMLELRELIAYDNYGILVVICGNQRLIALRELNEAKTFVKILPTDTPKEKLRAYVIKDNVAFGQDDFDLLKSEWDRIELDSFGLDIPDFGENINLDDFFEQDNSEQKENKNKIILEYNDEDFQKLNEAFKSHSGSKEEIVFKLLCS